MSDFLGRSINGDVSHYSSLPPEQHDPQEFLDILDAILSLGMVKAVRWHQYTPYFNDGDACEFSISEFSVKLDKDHLEDEEDYNDFFDEYDFYRTYENDSYPRGELVSASILGKDVTEVVKSLNKLEEIAAHHEVILLEKFGDPAEVTATKDGFQVEYYEHD